MRSTRSRRRDPEAAGGRRTVVVAAALIAIIAATVIGVAATSSKPSGTTSKASGSRATETSLNNPSGVRVAADQSVFIAESGSNLVRRVAPDGTITTIAGNGRAGFSGDGGPATAASLSGPSDVAITADHSVLIADSGNNRIRKIAPDGTITTIAGGAATSPPDDPDTLRANGGPATDAQLDNPSALAVAADGSIVIADSGHNALRLVAVDGTISTIAGNGEPGFSGDGGAATAATLNDPQGVAVYPDGTILVADLLNNRVRQIARNGVITTVAGTGQPGFSGDGGPATAATLSSPVGVAIPPDGTIVIADFGADEQRVRKVARDGTISTIAGNGQTGFSGDGAQATAASLSSPSGVAAASDGSVVIADSKNNRVRKVASDGSITTIAGNGT